MPASGRLLLDTNIVIALLEGDGNAGRLVNQNLGGGDAGNFEAGLLDFDLVEARNQGREQECSLVVGGLRQSSDRTGDSDLGPRNS